MSKAIRIVSFQAHHCQAFLDLNLAWIEKFFVPEEPDLKSLKDPMGYFIEPGGAILLAEDSNGEVLGTVGMIPLSGNRYELAKMAVSDTAKGRGIGYALGEAAIEWARDKGACEVYLETNAILTPALKLYEKLGFARVQRGTSPYARADVQMALAL